MTDLPDHTPCPWRCRDFGTTLILENFAGQEVCRFYAVNPIDRANAEFIVRMANSWSSADALRTRCVELTQLYSPTDSQDAPMEPLI